MDKLKLNKLRSDRIIENGLISDLYWQTTYFKEFDFLIKNLKSKLIEKHKLNEWKNKFNEHMSLTNLDDHKARIDNVFNALFRLTEHDEIESDLMDRIYQKEVCVNYSINELFYNIKGQDLAMVFNKLINPVEKFQNMIPLKFVSDMGHDKPFRFVDSTLYDSITGALIITEIKVKSGSKYTMLKLLRYLRIYCQLKEGQYKFDNQNINKDKIYHVFIHPSDKDALSYISNGEKWLVKLKPNVLKVNESEFENKIQEMIKSNHKEFNRIISKYALFSNTKYILKNIDELPIHTINYADLKSALTNLCTLKTNNDYIKENLSLIDNL